MIRYFPKSEEINLSNLNKNGAKFIQTSLSLIMRDLLTICYKILFGRILFERIYSNQIYALLREIIVPNLKDNQEVKNHIFNAS